MKFTTPLPRKYRQAFVAMTEAHAGSTPLANGEINEQPASAFNIEVKEGAGKRWNSIPDEDRPYRPARFATLAEASEHYRQLAPHYTGAGEGIRITRLMVYPEIIDAANRLGITLRSFGHAYRRNERHRHYPPRSISGGSSPTGELK
ncbi:MAG: hypothetical protein ISN29_11450 [Gammaproteobacteria bacterium AqS3]|nr:hypothetical protein [Gammaproteobacteria bacterium AqS3]